MKDCSDDTLSEAVLKEIILQLVQAIQIMDEKVVRRRLLVLLSYNVMDVTFISIAGQFLSVLNCKTSADNMEVEE